MSPVPARDVQPGDTLILHLARRDCPVCVTRVIPGIDDAGPTVLLGCLCRDGQVVTHGFRAGEVLDRVTEGRAAA